MESSSSSLFVVVVVALLSSVHGEKIRTLNDIHTLGKGIGFLEDFDERWISIEYHNNMLLSIIVPPHHAVFKNLTREVLKYSNIFLRNAALEFLSSLSYVTLRSLGQDLYVTCGEYLEWKIEIRNRTCLYMWVKKWMKAELERAAEVTLKKLSADCRLHRRGSTVCPRALANSCVSTLGRNFATETSEYIYDWLNTLTYERRYSIYPLYQSVVVFVYTLPTLTETFTYFNYNLYKIVNLAPSIEPLEYDNLLRGKFIRIFSVLKDVLRSSFVPRTRDVFSWGIIRSSSGEVEDQCVTFRGIYPPDSREYDGYYSLCFYLGILESYVDLLRCSLAEDLAESPPLSWSTAPSLFVHSECLCAQYNGTECRVRAPEGVQLADHCFSTLLRDFRRQVTFRPALTYLDYASATKVGGCQLTNLIQNRFRGVCEGFDLRNFSSVLAARCSFGGLLNRSLDCPEVSDDDGTTSLCYPFLFADFVACDADADASVPFYSAGASPLVRVLTCLDASARSLTLVTFLACPQLRNLPGKLLVGYQATALLRLLLVLLALPEDLALAARVDVSLDLSSTLWLTAFLHFLTSSIKTLRAPDSLTPLEARGVLLRYSSMGWLLPAALSAAFFSLDDALRSRVSCGQVLFVLCYFAALLWNLHMFYFNCKFYHDVKKGAASLKPGAKARDVFTGLLNFALKTAVLSGAGIIFRLLFAQVQGLEELLGYYHALGSLQGLLVFLFYGCSREARAFWRRVFTEKLLPCFRAPQNTVV